MAPRPPYRYPLGQKLKQDLERALTSIEPYRRRTYNTLIGSLVGAILLAPLLILFLALAAKHGWLLWMASLKPYFGWLSSSSHRSSRGMGRAIMALLWAGGAGILELTRHYVFKRIKTSVMPIICTELNLKASYGKLKRKDLSATFKHGINQLENPLSMEGTTMGVSFTAHVILAKRVKEPPWWDTLLNGQRMPQLETVFEGLLVTLPHALEKAPEILITHKDSLLSPGKLKQVFFEEEDYEKLFNVWSNAPWKARMFLRKDFLNDIKAWDERREDLPKLDFHLKSKQVVLFIPAEIRHWHIQKQISQPMGDIAPLATMLTQWDIFKAQMETLLKTYPELFPG